MDTNTERPPNADLERLPAVHRLAASNTAAQLLERLETALDALYIHHAVAADRLRGELSCWAEERTPGCAGCDEGLQDLVGRIVAVESGINRLAEIRSSVVQIETDLPEPLVEEVAETVEAMRETLQEIEEVEG